MAAVPGSARLVLVEGVVHLNEPQAVFEAMLKGWERQQRSRLLGEATIVQRERLVRRFTEFAEAFPWAWRASDVEDFTVSLTSGEGRLAHSTIRGYHLSLRRSEAEQILVDIRKPLRHEPLGPLGHIQKDARRAGFLQLAVDRAADALLVGRRGRGLLRVIVAEHRLHRRESRVAEALRESHDGGRLHRALARDVADPVDHDARAVLLDVARHALELTRERLEVGRDAREQPVHLRICRPGAAGRAARSLRARHRWSIHSCAGSLWKCHTRFGPAITFR